MRAELIKLPDLAPHLTLQPDFSWSAVANRLDDVFVCCITVGGYKNCLLYRQANDDTSKVAEMKITLSLGSPREEV